MDLLFSHVRLDHAVQSGAESLSKINETLYELAGSYISENGRWDSTERLLEFLLPPGLPSYSMNEVVQFCFRVQRRESAFQGVFNQVHLEHKSVPEFIINFRF